MSQKHDTQSNPYEFKQKDMNEKQHEFVDEQLYPSSTDDMTCWEKFKNAWNNFINRSIDYLEFDRLFNCEGEQKIEINKCYKRFLENYDETYSERQIRFAYTFEYVLEEKIKEESRKQKNFFQELYRFLCCEGGNQMVEIDEAYKSEREYQKIVRRKLIEKKQMFQQMLKKQIEEGREKQIQQEKKIKEKIQSQRKKKEFNQQNKQNPQEFISYEDFCFEEDDAKNNKIDKAAPKEVKQFSKLKTNLVKVRQNQHPILQNQSQLNISQITQKKKSTPTTIIKSTKQTQKNQELIEYNDDLDDFLHQNSKQQRMMKDKNHSSAKNQITKNIISTTMTHQNIVKQNHVYDKVQELDIKKQKKRKQNPVQQNDQFQESTTNNVANSKSKEISSTQKRNQQSYQSSSKNNLNNNRQYSNLSVQNEQPSPEYKYQYSTAQGKKNESMQNPLKEQNERYNSKINNSALSFQQNESNNRSQDRKDNSTRINLNNNLQTYNPSYHNDLENAQISHQKVNKIKNPEGRSQIRQQPINAKNQKPSPLIYNDKNQNNQAYDTQILSPGKQRQRQQLQSSPKINNNQTNMVFDQFQEAPQTNLTTSQKKRKSKRQQQRVDDKLQDQRQFDGLESNYQNNKLSNQKQEKIEVVLKAKKAKKSDPYEQAEDNIQIQYDDYPQTQQSQPAGSPITKKMKKKGKNINNPNEKNFDNQIDVIDDYQIQQPEDSQEAYANHTQKVIKKRKAKKNMVKKDVSDNQQIEIDNEITESNQQSMKPKWNTIDVSNLNQSENVIQASKKRRNKKQLRNNQDDLKIDEVILQENNDFGLASNHQEQEIGGSSFVKAEKKRKKGRQIRERQDQDEQIIQIDF